MSNYNFENIPLWTGDDSGFDILSDEENGRIPVTRIESWREFSEILEHDFFNRAKTQLVFRGHRRYDWGLMPTLARIPESGIINRELAENQLEYFRRAVRGRLPNSTLLHEDEEDELWSVGQHHGLLTPLLDWTYSPYVALFFAFSKEDSEEEFENPYRAIYVLNKTFVADDELCPDIRMFEPRNDDHGRLVNQAGLFTFSPYESTIENTLTDTISSEDFSDENLRNASEEEQAGIIANYICKIYIKNEDREGCMRHLRRMNVHHASLFPDLIGASEYCNLMVAEEHRAYELEESEKRFNKESSVESERETSKNFDVGHTFVADDKDTATIASIIDISTGSTVEHGRVQLIAEKLTAELGKLKTVDWHKREPVLSAMRAKARVILRKYGYPSQYRDKAADGVIEYMLAEYQRESA